MADTPRPLRERLRTEARRLQVPIDVVERDYALGHVLAAVYASDALAPALVFKGGTALKKAYFGDYRFSVDLDFTATAGPRGGELEREVARVATDVGRRLAEYGPFAVSASRQPERQVHPAGQEAFRVLIQFPWQPAPLCSIKLEITVDEPVLLAVCERTLMHGYDEKLAATLRCYTLEEIVAEKLRTLLQAQRRLVEGHWLRDCARDYYDLWRLCAELTAAVDLQAVVAILPEKCAVRGVSYASVDDFFPARIVAGAARQWGTVLADLVKLLPAFQTTLDELRETLGRHLRPRT